MDLITTTGGPILWRFPRPRGDGPRRTKRRRSIRRVSPPTRGWTPLRVVAGRPDGGFPAHAGMDPLGSAPARLGAGFPRPRGDGPADDDAHRQERLVSPPTRGWTLDAQPSHMERPGFPAHAGMDLVCLDTPTASAGFPRPRGDGPVCVVDARAGRSVSPPTRGWTRWRYVGVASSGGFPAHAGMDPPRCHGTDTVGGFPRPRGDGPTGGSNAVFVRRVSPPTRGWTFPMLISAVVKSGFPAHAGMDRTDTPGMPGAKRFPRPRGDGPAPATMARRRPAVSPPTRGWTFLGVLTAAGRGGFPAHAGMDPRPPRTR